MVLVALLPVAVSSPPLLPVDCADVYSRGSGSSGVYTIYPAGPTSPVQVYCDMGCVDEPEGGRWTVCVGGPLYVVVVWFLMSFKG